VLPFTGPDGAEFTEALTSALQDAKLDGQPYFSLKSADNISAPSPPAATKGGRNRRGTGGASATTDKEIAQAIQIGRRLGVQAVYTGRVTTADVTGGPYKLPVKTGGETTYRDCFKSTGQYGVTPKLIRVDTGAVVYAESITQAETYDYCGGDGTLSGNLATVFTNALFKKKKSVELQTPEGVRAKMRADAAAKVRLQVAPYNQTLQIEFKRSAKDVPKADREQFANAIAFADAARLDRACSIFETMKTEANAANVTLLFNLGACQEALLPDEPSAALAYYARADELLSRPDKMISEAYLRLKAMVSGDRAIRR
jgi:hypothetical protein